MISMVEKINRFGLTNCGEPLAFMRRELSRHWDEFYNGAYIEEFEKEWMQKFVKQSKARKRTA
jgi:hypothetical protein